jgi:hypothetical protein
VIAAWRAGNLYAVPFMLLYVGGFGLTALLGLWQAWGSYWRARRRRARWGRGSGRVTETG